jgi:hypothetical protein
MPQAPSTRREHRAVYQAVSARSARRHAEPWTEADDAVLLAEEGGTVLERAQRLERSYYACQNRLAYLRPRRFRRPRVDEIP